jgi:pyruvate formate lyase activating enzyme
VEDKTDLFIIDLKIFDSFQHRYYTGKGNEIIKENFRYIAALGKEIIIRIPLIDKITNTEENLKAITDFVQKTRNDIPIEKVEFNPLAGNNYKKLGIPFLLK